MRFSAEDLLSALLEAAPRPTVQAPRDARGLYGLVNHHGDLRYIGSTSSTYQTFYERIQGSDQDHHLEHPDRRGRGRGGGRRRRYHRPGAAERELLMSAFAAAVGALFADPNIGRDAVYVVFRPELSRFFHREVSHL